jgi:AraC-like DNA-binding protein
MVRWDLRGQPPRLAETLPHPCVYWVTELGQSVIYGVATARFSRYLRDKGRVFGLRFRPGGFHPFLGSPISALTDTQLSLERAFGREGKVLERALVRLDRDASSTPELPSSGAPDPDDLTDEAMMDLTERFLLDRVPAVDPRLATIAEMVSVIAGSPEITRVENVAERFGIGVRALQRLFSQFVGVSPKWVIKRYRLHEAVERLDAGAPVSFARLAADLGYFDQTHFIKDFRALIGRSPGDYARGVLPE